MSRIHAFGDDALGDLDAVGLVDALRSGKVSALELVDAAIARTEAVNPKLNGLAYEAFDRARVRATSTRPYGGYFDGVPSYIKDNVAVAGMPTMQGTDAWDPRPMPTDGAFARVFLGTGLVPLGRTQMSEFGFSGSAEHPRIGPVRNPWNPEHTAGASSSGSAAFVAAGVVPIAHANDGGGSIRIPASCNGLVGLKPTRGRLPLDKETARMPLHLVSNGVVSRSVRDTAAFLREAERIYRSPKLPEIGDVTQPDSAGSQSGDPRADTQDRGAAGRTGSQGDRDRQPGAGPVQR
jgi:amidase